MKFVIALFIALPHAASADQIYNQGQFDWADLGTAVTTEGPVGAPCVTGDQKETALASPKVVYRFYATKDSTGDYQAVAEILVIRGRAELANVKRKGASPLLSTCGSSFIQSFALGNRFAVIKFIDAKEAKTIQAFELNETITSRVAEFLSLVKQAESKLKTVSGGGAAYTIVNDFDLKKAASSTAFETYRSLALADTIHDRAVLAKAVSYP